MAFPDPTKTSSSTLRRMSSPASLSSPVSPTRPTASNFPSQPHSSPTPQRPGRAATWPTENNAFPHTTKTPTTSPPTPSIGHSQQPRPVAPKPTTAVAGPMPESTPTVPTTFAQRPSASVSAAAAARFPGIPAPDRRPIYAAATSFPAAAASLPPVSPPLGPSLPAMQYDRCVDIVTSLAARYQNARLERIGYQEQADAMAGNDFPASRPGIPNALWGRYVQGAQSVAQGLVRKLEATEVDLLAKLIDYRDNWKRWFGAELNLEDVGIRLGEGCLDASGTSEFVGSTREIYLRRVRRRLGLPEVEPPEMEESGTWGPPGLASLGMSGQTLGQPAVGPPRNGAAGQEFSHPAAGQLATGCSRAGAAAQAAQGQGTAGPPLQAPLSSVPAHMRGRAKSPGLTGPRWRGG